MHISKPHWEGDLLVVNAVNPTAGLFAGDSILCEATVEAGASLLLTSASSQRAHRMPHGEASVEQHFTVRSGGWLEISPELFIPQAGARYRQTTRAEVEAGGELLLFETLAPGRVAAGEIFAFDSMGWETDLLHDGQNVAREKYTLRPGDESLHPLKALFPAAYYGSCFAIGSRFLEDEACWTAVAALNSASVHLGCSRLCAGGWVVKILGMSGPDLRGAMRAVRGLLYTAAGRAEPAFRRF